MARFNMIKTVIAVALSAMLLGGCATVQSSPSLPLVISQCPALTKYTQAQLNKAAAEMRSLPTESQVAKLVTDYGKLRDACRVANSKIKKANGL